MSLKLTLQSSIEANQISIVKLILAKHPNLLNEYCIPYSTDKNYVNYGYTPLGYAIYKKRIDVVELLVTYPNISHEKTETALSSASESIAKVMIEAGACQLNQVEANQTYKAILNEALDASLAFLSQLTSKYHQDPVEVIQRICEYNTTYRAINPVNLLRRSKETRLDMDNITSLATLLENLISEKSERLQANQEQQRELLKEESVLSTELWNLRGLAHVLAPLVEELTKPSILAFKEKYGDSQAVQIAEMTAENVEGFWLCAQLPAQVLTNAPIQSSEMEDLFDFYLENDIKITSLKARKQYFNQLDLLNNGQFFAKADTPNGKMFSMTLHKKQCSVCRQDTFEKFKVFLQENECEELLDLEVVKKLGIFGEEVIYLTKDDLAKHLKVPRTKFKQLKVNIDRWRAIHKNAFSHSKNV